MLRHQAVLLDFDAQSNLAAVSATNAIELTIGSSHGRAGTDRSLSVPIAKKPRRSRPVGRRPDPRPVR